MNSSVSVIRKEKICSSQTASILFYTIRSRVSRIRAITDADEEKMDRCTASLHKLAAGRKLATTHLNVSNRQMCGCTGFKSGGYNKSYYNRPFKNDTGL